MWSLQFLIGRAKLILSRDRFGEKPLYYLKTSNGVFFGSEIDYRRFIFFKTRGKQK